MNMSEESKSKEITALLQFWKEGDEKAGDVLFDLIYPDLRKIAGRILNREYGNASLQTTDIINETYLKLLGQQGSWQNRHHFFAVSARVVRRVVIDHARARNRLKRGGVDRPLGLDQIEEPAGKGMNWLALDEALRALAALDSPAARVCELRYFGGLTLDEVAQVMNMGRATAVRHWQFARAWLKKELQR